MNTKLRGQWGENLALEYLQTQGYTGIAAGYRTRYGEIDLIVEDSEYIVFVEVKLRKNDRFAEAREFVDGRKQVRIKTTAEMWLAENETLLQPRFDVIEIYAPEGVNTKNTKIIHLENAF